MPPLLKFESPTFAFHLVHRREPRDAWSVMNDLRQAIEERNDLELAGLWAQLACSMGFTNPIGDLVLDTWGVDVVGDAPPPPGTVVVISEAGRLPPGT